MKEVDYYLFPIRNENGFKVDCTENYKHLFQVIYSETLKLQEEYPLHNIIVYYELYEGPDVSS